MLVRTLFGLLFLLVASVVHAQTPNSTDPLLISVTPEFPRPYDTITITPDSTLLDLASTDITVSVNGAAIYKGSGQQGAQYTMGAPGTKAVIHMTGVYNGKTYDRELTVTPADVALILEPNSTTHPFYEGGALTAPEGRIRIVAVPDIRTSAQARISADKLSYTWRLGDRVLLSDSGIGRSVLTATAPVQYRDAPISVTVSTVDGAIAAHTSVTVASADPSIVVYKNDPLLGIDFANAVSGIFSMTGNETTFRAVPYFFGQTPGLSWTLNSNPAGTDRDLTARTTSASAGSAVIGVTATNNTQSATDSYTVNFAARKGSSIFGF